MIVKRRTFEDRLRATLEKTQDPAFGIYGPDTMSWKVLRESIVFLGAGRASLLQLSHPYVAQAIVEHSETRADPIGRFNRTFMHIYSMVFGDLAHVDDAAHRVRRIHDAVHGRLEEELGRFRVGHRYHANDAGALLWVLATLIDTAVQCYEIGFGPMTADEKEAFYAEVGRFGALFGLGDELPASWPAFEAYFARAVDSDEIVVSHAARTIGGFLLEGHRRTARPVMRWYRTITAGLLPARLRAPWELSFGLAERAVFESSLRALRATWPRLPRRARFVPAYVEAQRRLAGAPRPDRVGRAVEQWLLRFVQPGVVHG